MFNCILCPIDGSEHSDKASALASDLALRYGAKLCFLHVFMRAISIDELQRFSTHGDLKAIVEAETEKLTGLSRATLGMDATPYVLPPLTRDHFQNC